MIPIILFMVLMLETAAAFANPTPGTPADAQGAPAATQAATCLESGDGYFRARVAGAIEANIDWPNSGTRCEGEPRDKPPGVREGQSLREAGANLTVIVQGTNRIFGTLGDSRCTVDSLTQRALKAAGSFRVEARGFCTQPAHAVRGDGAVLVSTFEFAGLVTYDAPKN